MCLERSAPWHAGDVANSRIASPEGQSPADKDVRNIGNSPYGGGYRPLNTEKEVNPIAQVVHVIIRNVNRG